MTTRSYPEDERVQVFMPDVQRLVAGDVLDATTSRVLVSLDDRMPCIAVDPADSFRIQPLGTAASLFWGGGL